MSSNRFESNVKSIPKGWFVFESLESFILKKNSAAEKDCPHCFFTALEAAEVFKYLSGERATSNFEKFR